MHHLKKYSAAASSGVSPGMSVNIVAAGIIAAILACAGTPLAAQEIAKLYAPQAPAGSSFVRVLNATGKPMKVAFGNRQDALDSRGKIATDYRVVDAAAKVAIQTDGKTTAQIAVQPGSFNTVVYTGNAAPLPIVDSTDSRNDLKAELRFYNLAAGCDATLSLENGSVIFPHVAYANSARRSINPVSARLSGRCDQAAANGAAAGTATPVALPALKSGDHASLFLLGDSAAPRLVVQVDATEPYAAPR